MKRGTALLAVLALAGAAAAAQDVPTGDPLRCWWRTSAGSVAIGEPFEATLTCAVREQNAVRVVPDESRLSAATIQLPPFEILGGAHPGDQRSPTHRFLQYHYTLRVIDRDVIGRDARFPDLQVPYRVQTLVGGEWTQGRDRSYLVPGRPVRVQSLVPVEADDIRDSADETFARIETLQFRARALRILAVTLVLLGGVLAVPAMFRVVRRGRPAVDAADRRPSRAALVRAAERELQAVAIEGGGGWSPDLAFRALTAVRVAAAATTGRAVAQASSEATPAQLTVAVGWIKRRRVAVSSSTTAADVASDIAALPPTAGATRRHALEQLHDAMATLTQAVYGADSAGRGNNPAIHDAVTGALTALGALKRRR